MDRRKFMVSALTSLSALATAPVLIQDPSSVIAPSTVAKIDPAIASKIKSLESMIAATPGMFDWAAHNELRHLYLSIDEHKAMEHADIILAHSLMDVYILNTLSEWHIEQDPQLAAATLMSRAERNQFWPHLVAACLIKTGDIVKIHGRSGEGDRFYHAVVSFSQQRAIAPSTLKQYEHLARVRLIM